MGCSGGAFLWSAGARGSLALILISSATFFISLAASADPTFPGFLETNYTPCLPDCTLCHTTEAGGTGLFRNATKADGTIVHTGGFGDELLNRFYIDTSNPGPAFEEDSKYVNSDGSVGYDTDQDGVPDIAELRAGTDPNSADPNSTFCSDLKYGCVGRVSPKGSVDGVASVASAAVLLVGLGLLRRRG